MKGQAENRRQWEARKVILVAISILVSLYFAIGMRFISIPRFSEKTAADCFLENFKDVRERGDARLLYKVCKERFPRQT